MKSAVAEITRITRSLPPKRAAQLLSYARSLQRPPSRKSKGAKREEELDGDAEWERMINDPRPRPKLEEVRRRIERLEREEKLEPLDFDKL